MLKLYFGEFLLSPFPLELSYGKCDYGCAYCYQYLRRSHFPTHLEFSGTLNTIVRPDQYSNTIAQLITRGYPIVISNHTDPFCPSNQEYTQAIVRACIDSNVPVSFQTKTGSFLLDIAAMLPPSVFAITLTTLDENIRQEIEPGAPSVAYRLDCIEKLAGMGHGVVVYCIPYIPECVPNPAHYVSTIKNAGAEVLYTELLRFRNTHIKATNRDSLPPLIKKYFTAKRQTFTATELIAEAQAAGLITYGCAQPTPSGYPDFVRRYYNKTFPTISDFIKYAYEADEQRRAQESPDEEADVSYILFEDFADFMAPLFPDDVRVRVDDYARVIIRNNAIVNKFPHPTWGTYRDVLYAAWNPAISHCRLDTHPCFAMLCAEWDGDLVRLLDHDGNNIFVFSKRLFDSHFYVVDVDHNLWERR